MTLRLGELEAEVDARREGDTAAGAIVKRDLGRYYRMCRVTARGVFFGFTLPEAEALVLAIGARFDEAAAKYIWAEVEKEYRELADEADGGWHNYLPTDFDPMPLIERLRKLRLHEAMVVLDAVERYWVRHSLKHGSIGFETDGDVLVEVGILSKGQLKHGLERRDQIREEQKAGKLVLRDFLGRLRTSTHDDFGDGDPAAPDDSSPAPLF